MSFCSTGSNLQRKCDGPECPFGALWAVSIVQIGQRREEMLTSACDTDLALIQELWDEYASAVTAGDLERWISLWTRGGIEISGAGRLLSGAKNIRAARQPVMDLFDTKMTITPEGVQILGDSAYSYGSYKHVVTPKEGGDSIGNSGRFLTVLQKQAAGSWKIVVACFNEGR